MPDSPSPQTTVTLPIQFGLDDECPGFVHVGGIIAGEIWQLADGRWHWWTEAIGVRSGEGDCDTQDEARAALIEVLKGQAA